MVFIFSLNISKSVPDSIFIIRILSRLIEGIKPLYSICFPFLDMTGGTVVFQEEQFFGPQSFVLCQMQQHPPGPGPDWKSVRQRPVVQDGWFPE
jgi:hypothetical protein